MTDITPLVNDLLKSHNTRLVQQPPFSIDNLNAFLREAYQIVRREFIIASIYLLTLRDRTRASPIS